MDELNYLSSLNEDGKGGSGKLKPRKVKWLAQGHPAQVSSKAWTLNPLATVN
jgi:hypothetical protein